MKTEHFDIIYDLNSAENAFKLYENCEEIYNSTLGMFEYGKSKVYFNKSIPVVLTSEKKTFNGSFSAYPANSIVLHNTQIGINNLTNYQDNILDVFRHELVHAMLFNYRNKTVNIFSKIFSDALSLTAVNVYQGFSEGLSVFEESRNEYGRLNDPSVTALIKQAKYDGSFPDWMQVTGAKDIYPNGDLFYYFTGAFFDYLSKTYSVEKLEEFLFECSKVQFKTTRVVFKNVFDNTLYGVWSDFSESIVIPENVLANNIDVLTSKSDYTILSALNNDLVLLDSAASILLKKNDLGFEKIGKVNTYEASLNVSSDGCFVIPLNDSDNEKVLVYDSQFNIIESYNGYRSGCIIDDSRICLLKCSGDNSSLEIVDRLSKSILSSVCLGSNVNVGFMCSKDSNVYCIGSVSGQDRIAVFEPDTKKVFTLEIPDFTERLFIRSLGISDNNLCFTYFKDNSFARLGKISLDGSYTLSLSNADVSGGVYSPVLSGDLVYFISRFMDGSCICRTSLSNLDVSEYGSMQKTELKLAETTFKAPKAEAYKPLRYMKNFTFIPCFTYVGVDSVSTDDFMPLSGSFIAQDSTQTWTFTLGGGYDLKTSNTVLNFSVSNSAHPVKLKANFSFSPSARTLLGSFEASYTKPIKSLLNCVSLSQTVAALTTFDSSKSFDWISSTYAGYYNYCSSGLYNSSYVGPAAAIQLDILNSDYRSVSAAASYKFVFKEHGSEAKVGLYNSNYDESYYWAQLSTSLVSREVQSGIYDLYINRVGVDLDYVLRYFGNDSSMIHTAGAQAYATLTPVQGMATALRVNVGLKANWQISPIQKPGLKLFVSIASSSFNISAKPEL